MSSIATYEQYLLVIGTSAAPDDRVRSALAVSRREHAALAAGVAAALGSPPAGGGAGTGAEVTVASSKVQCVGRSQPSFGMAINDLGELTGYTAVEAGAECGAEQAQIPLRSAIVAINGVRCDGKGAIVAQLGAAGDAAVLFTIRPAFSPFSLSLRARLYASCSPADEAFRDRQRDVLVAHGLAPRGDALGLAAAVRGHAGTAAAPRESALLLLARLIHALKYFPLEEGDDLQQGGEDICSSSTEEVSAVLAPFLAASGLDSGDYVSADLVSAVYCCSRELLRGGVAVASALSSDAEARIGDSDTTLLAKVLSMWLVADAEYAAAASADYVSAMLLAGDDAEAQAARSQRECAVLDALGATLQVSEMPAQLLGPPFHAELSEQLVVRASRFVHAEHATVGDVADIFERLVQLDAPPLIPRFEEACCGALASMIDSTVDVKARDMWQVQAANVEVSDTALFDCLSYAAQASTSLVALGFTRPLIGGHVAALAELGRSMASALSSASTMDESIALLKQLCMLRDSFDRMEASLPSGGEAPAFSSMFDEQVEAACDALAASTRGEFSAAFALPEGRSLPWTPLSLLLEDDDADIFGFLSMLSAELLLDTPTESRWQVTGKASHRVFVALLQACGEKMTGWRSARKSDDAALMLADIVWLGELFGVQGRGILPRAVLQHESTTLLRYVANVASRATKDLRADLEALSAPAAVQEDGSPWTLSAVERELQTRS